MDNFAVHNLSVTFSLFRCAESHVDCHMSLFRFNSSILFCRKEINIIENIIHGSVLLCCSKFACQLCLNCSHCLFILFTARLDIIRLQDSILRQVRFLARYCRNNDTAVLISELCLGSFCFSLSFTLCFCLALCLRLSGHFLHFLRDFLFRLRSTLFGHSLRFRSCCLSSCFCSSLRGCRLSSCLRSRNLCGLRCFRCRSRGFCGLRCFRCRSRGRCFCGFRCFFCSRCHRCFSNCFLCQNGHTGIGKYHYKSQQECQKLFADLLLSFHCYPPFLCYFLVFENVFVFLSHIFGIILS